MAGRMRKWAGAAIVALAMTMLAGDALALTAVRKAGDPLGGPIRWTEVFRMQAVAGITLIGPGGAISLHPRVIGVYGRVGWGTQRLTNTVR